MGTHVYIDSAAHPTAAAYYEGGRREPTFPGWWVTATRVVAARGITLEAILSDLAAHAAPGDSVIIVSHGRDTGLSLRILPRKDARGRIEILNALGNYDERRMADFTIPATSEAEAARVIGNNFTEADVAHLRGLIRQVRARRLNHVALRACMVGSYADAMASYQAFFGAQSLSAPRHVRDTFGSVTPTVGERGVAQWRRRHEGAIPFTTRHGQVEVWTSAPRPDHSYRVAMRADSQAALQDWVTRWLSGGPAYSGGTVHYHGFYRMAPAPNESAVVFPGDPAFYGFLGTSGRAMRAQPAAPPRRAVARVPADAVLAAQRAAGNRAAARLATGEVALPDGLREPGPVPLPLPAPVAGRGLHRTRNR